MPALTSGHGGRRARKAVRLRPVRHLPPPLASSPSSRAAASPRRASSKKSPLSTPPGRAGEVLRPPLHLPPRNVPSRGAARCRLSHRWLRFGDGRALLGPGQAGPAVVDDVVAAFESTKVYPLLSAHPAVEPQLAILYTAWLAMSLPRGTTVLTARGRIHKLPLSKAERP